MKLRKELANFINFPIDPEEEKKEDELFDPLKIPIIEE